ncbi:MAG: DUF5717 family protein, partial [Lachnospiraceae bacterium]|nr:DUF5717 family protein [Lachnospiraceae bacterium]
PCEAAYGKITELFDRREPIDFAMKLAMLKYDSSLRELSDRQYMRDKAVLAECAKRGIRLGFMKKLPEELIRPYRLLERQFVEQKAGMADDVLITWSVRTGLNGEAGSWKTEQLPRRFRTVCSKEFMLFYGETLTYTITVRDQEGDHTVEPRTIRGDNVRMNGSDSFPRINRMLQCAAEGREDTLREEIGSYMKARNTAKTLFTLEETL